MTNLLVVAVGALRVGGAAGESSGLLAHRVHGLVVGELRSAGREVDAEVLAHISPARSSVVNYYGSITVDYEHELAQLDEQGHRPLRTAGMDDPGAGL